MGGTGVGGTGVGGTGTVGTGTAGITVGTDREMLKHRRTSLIREA
jgi:hypothetical protein